MAWFEFRKMTAWTRPVTPGHKRRSADQFRADWDDTLDLLGKECEYLGGSLVVVEVDLAEGVRVRRDGVLRSDAKVSFPGVIVSFESKHGPLTYATDAYEKRWTGGGLNSWQANVRAIALSLQALRAVDRYGVTHTGEQYQGWTAISARPAEMTRDQAAEFILTWATPGGEPPRWSQQQLLTDPDALKRAYLAAMKAVHVDRDPSHADTTARLNRARDIITGRNQADDT